MNDVDLSAPPYHDRADEAWADHEPAQATPPDAIDATGDASGPVMGQAGEAIVLQRPAPGETVTIEAAPGQTYVLDFAPTQAAVLIEGRNFVLAFDDNGDGTPDSRIVVRDLLDVAGSGAGPTFEIGGVAVDADILLGQAVALAGGEDVPPDDVAAGPGAAGGGATVYSDDLGDVLDLLAAQGVIPPVALQFGLPDPEEEETLLLADADEPGTAPVDPVLIVGENVSDHVEQSVPHRTPGDETGEIVGGDGDDVLIGDIGGHTLINKVMNLALVLDTSNSMESTISFDGESMMRIEALDRAVEQALDALVGAAGATVRLHMVSFADGVKDQQTFDIIVEGVVDAAALQAAKDFILAAGEDPIQAAEGNTNYEAGLGAALDWFSDSGNTLDDPDYNRTIFISDGLPNRAFEGDGTTTVITPGSNAASLAHVLGSGGGDTVSEVAGLLGSFEGVAAALDAVGINVGASALARLHQIDGGDADSIEEGAVLAALLGDLSQATTLEPVGDDVLVGGAGDDLIFGDALFTDHLAADQGIGLPAGSGWSVIEDLAGNGFFDNDPLSSEAEEIIAFMRDPANRAAYDFGAESTGSGGRDGGNDLIDGGAGNDLIFGQEGNDLILGGTGDDTIWGGSGDDTMAGGSGSDRFAWGGTTSAGETDVVADFTLGAGNDVLDFTALLTGVAPGDGGSELDGWLQFGFDGANTTIGIDANGDGSGFTDLTVVAQGVDLTGGSAVQADIIDSLLANGNLQVA